MIYYRLHPNLVKCESKYIIFIEPNAFQNVCEMGDVIWLRHPWVKGDKIHAPYEDFGARSRYLRPG